MQPPPPLTGARKTLLVRATNDNTLKREKMQLTEKCSNPTFTTKLDNRRLTESFQVRGPYFRKVLWRTYEKLMKKSDLRKFRRSMWLSKKSYKNLMKNEVMQNLWKTYDYITVILRKRKIRGKWCHLGNPLSEAVIGRIFWAKNNWQQEWCFPKNAFEKWLTIFPRKS